MNIASVSKSLTGIAILKHYYFQGWSIDEPFYPRIRARVPVVGLGVDTVTVRNLLEMKVSQFGPPIEVDR